MNEQMLIALLSAGAGWALRHFGVLAPRAGAAAVGTPIPPVGPTTGLTGGIKGEIESIVKQAVEAAMAAALADIRGGLVPVPPPPKPK